MREIKRVQASPTLALILGKPCHCYDPGYRTIMAGVWIGAREEFTGKRQGQWTFWRYVGGAYVHSIAIFKTSSPRAALNLFLTRTGLVKLIHLDEWHVLRVARHPELS